MVLQIRMLIKRGWPGHDLHAPPLPFISYITPPYKFKSQEVRYLVRWPVALQLTLIHGEVFNNYKRHCIWMTTHLARSIGRASGWAEIRFERRFTAQLTSASMYVNNGILKHGHISTTTWSPTDADAALRIRRRRRSISINAI